MSKKIDVFDISEDWHDWVSDIAPLHRVPTICQKLVDILILAQIEPITVEQYKFLKHHITPLYLSALKHALTNSSQDIEYPYVTMRAAEHEFDNLTVYDNLLRKHYSTFPDMDVSIIITAEQSVTYYDSIIKTQYIIGAIQDARIVAGLMNSKKNHHSVLEYVDDLMSKGYSVNI